ncbi:type I restriction-modification system specificity determinant [Burkholderia pseudomallei]|uniref:restriction endonuclease subunit S n=1 Tax=Burkholderia pseudomallei TaxID=28450 RepID=UPI0005DA6BC5|nr:restriction endonuclease subunit S [Burkholderia pseudomallei]CAK1342333.1 type I restriction-modification system specificity determinant [Burkholderia pseudomallei]CAK1343120.1 type I restriction-modification system specificity determinant [Burkholderia pseudomallei]
MAREWRECALGEVVELKRGYDLPQQSRSPGDVPLVSSSGVTDYHSIAMVRGPGVVTGRYGTLGQVFYIEKDFWPLNTTLYVRDFKGNDPRFVSYFLRGVDFLAYSDKAAVPGLNRNHLHEARVRMPPNLEEQRAIAHILGTLDDKIELNRQRNETLEAMAGALFKDWFVDFGPVRAKMEGREPYLPREIWDLFPERLDDELPEGWGSLPASELIEFNPAEPLRKGAAAPYLDMASLPTRGSWPEPYVLRPFGSGMRFRNGDTLLARITPCLENGKTAFIQCLPDNVIGWGSTEYIVMRPKAPVPATFAYLLARDEAFRDHAIRSMTGTSGRQRAQGDSVAAYKIVAPSNEKLWIAFARLVTPLFDGIKANSEASVNLAGMRDVLLPKLISGERRIENAERFIGTAV